MIDATVVVRCPECEEERLDVELESTSFGGCGTCGYGEGAALEVVVKCRNPECAFAYRHAADEWFDATGMRRIFQTIAEETHGRWKATVKEAGDDG